MNILFISLAGFNSVVQWHPVSLFLVTAPLKIVVPKEGSLFFLGSLNN